MNPHTHTDDPNRYPCYFGGCAKENVVRKPRSEVAKAAWADWWRNPRKRYIYPVLIPVWLLFGALALPFYGFRYIADHIFDEFLLGYLGSAHIWCLNYGRQSVSAKVDPIMWHCRRCSTGNSTDYGNCFYCGYWNPGK